MSSINEQLLSKTHNNVYTNEKHYQFEKAKKNLNEIPFTDKRSWNDSANSDHGWHQADSSKRWWLQRSHVWLKRQCNSPFLRPQTTTGNYQKRQNVENTIKLKTPQVRERKRINEAGGFIAFRGVWRVAGILATSRAMGDYPLKEKNLVIADPDILTFELNDHK